VTIDAAVARGQGLTASGKPLEPMLMEAMIPPSVAVIIDCQAENRLRTLQDIRTILKHHGGSTSSVAYLFRKQGRIVFDALERGLGIADVLDDALDAGAEDIELNSEGALEVRVRRCPWLTNAVRKIQPFQLTLR
jgi:transcriptional/translational regulatory protein YebC/TACO1